MYQIQDKELNPDVMAHSTLGQFSHVFYTLKYLVSNSTI